MVFELNKAEIKIFNRWKNSLPELSEDCLDVFGKEFQYTFKFQPTGLGVVKIVEREYDGLQLNLTDYSHW
jgi:hypothetical protein